MKASLKQCFACLLLCNLWAISGGCGGQASAARMPHQSPVETRTYDVSNLLDDYSDTIPATGSQVGFSDRAVRLDEITKTITDQIDPASWQDNGGEIGQLSIGSDKSSLVIRQTQENQAKIHALLDQLKKAGKTPDGAP